MRDGAGQHIQGREGAGRTPRERGSSEGNRGRAARGSEGLDRMGQ